MSFRKKFSVRPSLGASRSKHSNQQTPVQPTPTQENNKIQKPESIITKSENVSSVSTKLTTKSLKDETSPIQSENRSKFDESQPEDLQKNEKLICQNNTDLCKTEINLENQNIEANKKSIENDLNDSKSFIIDEIHIKSNNIKKSENLPKINLPNKSSSANIKHNTTASCLSPEEANERSVRQYIENIMKDSSTTTNIRKKPLPNPKVKIWSQRHHIDLTLDDNAACGNDDNVNSNKEKNISVDKDSTILKSSLKTHTSKNVADISTNDSIEFTSIDDQSKNSNVTKNKLLKRKKTEVSENENIANENVTEGVAINNIENTASENVTEGVAINNIESDTSEINLISDENNESENEITKKKSSKSSTKSKINKSLSPKKKRKRNVISSSEEESDIDENDAKENKQSSALEKFTKKIEEKKRKKERNKRKPKNKNEKSNTEKKEKKASYPKKKKDSIEQDITKLTMEELIRYRPSSFKKVGLRIQEKDPNEHIVDDEADEENMLSNTDKLLNSVKTKKEESEFENDGEEECMAPQLTVNENGEIVIDESSLTIKKKVDDSVLKSRKILYENSLSANNLLRRKISKGKRWKLDETLRFYKALSQIGTDFTLMAQAFHNFTRNDLKKKFKQEEKVNCDLVDRALENRLPLNMEMFLRRKEDMIDAIDDDVESVTTDGGASIVDVDESVVK